MTPEEPQQPHETSAHFPADGELHKKFNPAIAAAVVGGTMAAAAGAYWGTRALARRNREEAGTPINSVLATAITACDLSHKKQPEEPAVASEPPVPAEPQV